MVCDGVPLSFAYLHAIFFDQICKQMFFFDNYFIFIQRSRNLIRALNASFFLSIFYSILDRHELITS